MKESKTLSSLLLISILSLMLGFLFLAGCAKETETEIKKEKAPIEKMKKPKVEGINEFHEVLFPVWHTYFPEADFESIKESVPEFERTMEILMKAELPQFYHTVKDDFEDKREDLSIAIEKLGIVAQIGDDKELAQAVEDVHTAFEKMARVLAPRIKELDDFHLVLYPLWHQAMPKKDYQAIKAAIPSLKTKMDALMMAELPEKFKGIELQFVEKRDVLKR